MKYMNQRKYFMHWRHRIRGMIVYFLDENKNVIPNNGDELFEMSIKYPDLFYNMDEDKVSHLFGAHLFECDSVYKRTNEPQKWCQVSDEFQFAKDIYSPSPNGTFTFTLNEFNNSLDLTKVHKFRVHISGSEVKFRNPNQERQGKRRSKSIFLNWASFFEFSSKRTEMQNEV